MPAASKTTWPFPTTAWTNASRQLANAWGKTILLGHHYQRDEVIRFADFTGDSYKLSKIAAETEAKYIVFCGVHFMAESADCARPRGSERHPAGPERRLLNGGYGGDLPGGRLLGVSRASSDLTTA